MKQRNATTIRRVILALSIIPAAWLILFATGAATLVGREQLHVGEAQGVTVICRYIRATGTYEVIDFTTDPDAVACARFVSVRSPPPVTGSRWAAPLPTDRLVQLECRFIRYPAEGDGGLGTRFTAEAPLRLAVNFSAGQLDLVSADDRSALGDPKQATPSNPASAMVMFEHGAAPIFTGEKPGRLTLVIFSSNGAPRCSCCHPVARCCGRAREDVGPARSRNPTGQQTRGSQAGEFLNQFLHLKAAA